MKILCISGFQVGCGLFFWGSKAQLGSHQIGTGSKPEVACKVVGVFSGAFLVNFRFTSGLILFNPTEFWNISMGHWPTRYSFSFRKLPFFGKESSSITKGRLFEFAWMNKSRERESNFFFCSHAWIIFSAKKSYYDAEQRRRNCATTVEETEWNIDKTADCWRFWQWRRHTL